MSRILQFFSFCRHCGKRRVTQEEIETFSGTDNRAAIRKEILEGADEVGIEYLNKCPRCASPGDTIEGHLVSRRKTRMN